MRRTFASLLLPVMLAGCGGGGGDGEVACEQQFWREPYGTCLPGGWSIVDRETLRQRGVPEEVIAAFQAEESVGGQFPAVTVTREPLAEPVEAAAYSEASIRSVSVLPGYEQIDRRSVTVDGQDVTLHVFTAQPVAGEAARRFYQMSTVGNGIGYTVTGTAPVSVRSTTEQAITLMLSRSTFLPPVQEEEGN